MQEGKTSLAHELHQWKDQAASESERRHQAEEEVHRLNLTIRAAQEHQQKLERQVKEWKLIAMRSKRSIVKYCQGVGRMLTVLEKLKSEPPVYTQDFSEMGSVAEEAATGPICLID